MAAPTPQPAADVLQPLNVQMGTLIEQMRLMNEAATLRTKGLKEEGDEQEKVRKKGIDVVRMLGDVGGSFGKLATTVNQSLGALTQVGDFLGSFVKKFSPMSLQFFGRAVDDLQAVIGERLMPVLRGATQVVRFFGDLTDAAFAKLGPVIAQVQAAVTPVFEAIGRTIKGVADTAWQAMAPVYAQLAPALAGVGRVVEGLLPAAGAVAEAFSGFQSVIMGGVMGAVNALVPALVPLAGVVSQLVANALVPFKVVVAALSVPLKALGGLLAVAGQALAIPLGVLGEAGRILTPLSAALTGALTDVFGLAGDVAGALGQLGGELVKTLGGALGGVFKGLVDVLKSVVGAVTLAVNGFRLLVGSVRGLFGLTAPQVAGLGDGSSNGRSAQQASTTSVQAFLQQLNEKAYGSAKAAKEDPLAKLPNVMGDLKTAVEQLPDGVKKAVVEGIKAAAGDIGREVGKYLPGGSGGRGVAGVGAEVGRQAMRALIPIPGLPF